MNGLGIADRNVVFVGDLSNPGGSSKQRLWALREAHARVASIDTSLHRRSLGLWGQRAVRLAGRPRWLAHARSLEREISETCEALRPAIVWFEWPKVFDPQFLTELKRKPDAPFLISFQDDNPFGERVGDRWMWRNYLRCVPAFDLHLIKRSSDAENLKRLGAVRTRLWEHGVYSPLYHSRGREAVKYPVTFIGTCMDDRAGFVERLLVQEKLPLHVFGARWRQRSRLPSLYPDRFHEAIWAEDYACVLRQSRMAIGLVSRSNHDEWTMRSYEIPACGALLIAPRTPSLLRLYDEGREALFFSNVEECADQIRWGLENANEVLNMAMRAVTKLESKELGLRDRMFDLIGEFEREELAGKLL